MHKKPEKDNIETASRTDKNDARRKFLKKAVYTAPTLIALGALTRSKEARAADFGTPPSAPDWQ